MHHTKHAPLRLRTIILSFAGGGLSPSNRTEFFNRDSLVTEDLRKSSVVNPAEFRPGLVAIVGDRSTAPVHVFVCGFVCVCIFGLFVCACISGELGIFV